MSSELEQNISAFTLQYFKYIEIKKIQIKNSNNFQSIKANLMFKLAKITSFILNDNGIFIKKFSKFVAGRLNCNKVTVSEFLSILLNKEIDFDFNFIMLLDIKFRFLILFYIIFNFIIEPNFKLTRSQILPSLNQCIYEFSNQGKCPNCKIYMNGEELLLNNYYYCYNCYHKHIIIKLIEF
jgi:hypothetical protein